MNADSEFHAQFLTPTPSLVSWVLAAVVVIGATATATLVFFAPMFYAGRLNAFTFFTMAAAATGLALLVRTVDARRSHLHYCGALALIDVALALSLAYSSREADPGSWRWLVCYGYAMLVFAVAAASMAGAPKIVLLIVAATSLPATAWITYVSNATPVTLPTWLTAATGLVSLFIWRRLTNTDMQLLEGPSDADHPCLEDCQRFAMTTRTPPDLPSNWRFLSWWLSLLIAALFGLWIGAIELVWTDRMPLVGGLLLASAALLFPAWTATDYGRMRQHNAAVGSVTIVLIGIIWIFLEPRNPNDVVTVVSYLGAVSTLAFAAWGTWRPWSRGAYLAAAIATLPFAAWITWVTDGFATYTPALLLVLVGSINWLNWRLVGWSQPFRGFRNPVS